MSKIVMLPKHTTVTQLSCKRCGHKWWGKLDVNGKLIIPKTCTSCKSPYWNKPITRHSTSESSKRKGLNNI